ncbi:hypothetical protein NBRC116594_38550 [Shimia sp. NS0008-38b]
MRAEGAYVSFICVSFAAAKLGACDGHENLRFGAVYVRICARQQYPFGFQQKKVWRFCDTVSFGAMSGDRQIAFARP